MSGLLGCQQLPHPREVELASLRIRKRIGRQTQQPIGQRCRVHVPRAHDSLEFGGREGRIGRRGIGRRQ